MAKEVLALYYVKEGVIVVMEEQLINFWKVIGEKIRILSDDEKERVWNVVKERYLKANVHIGYSICDAINYTIASGIDIADSWRWISDFVKNDTVILFFNKDWGNNFYEIENGSTFVKFYDEECGVIEFYITDKCASFLIAYNHSQCLVTLGTAREWLMSDIRYTKRYSV